MVTKSWAGKLTNHGLISGRSKKFFSTPKCFNQLWDSSNPLCCVYCGIILLGNCSRTKKMTTHFTLMLKLRMCLSNASAQPCALMVWYVIMQRHQFTFTSSSGFILSSILDSLRQRNFMLEIGFCSFQVPLKMGFCCLVSTAFVYL